MAATVPSTLKLGYCHDTSRDDRTPEEQVAETRAWKADLRSTPEGEATYQKMCAKAVGFAERLETRRSA